MLLAYNASGNVTATLDYLVQYDDNGTPLGLVDFAAHEEAGGEMTDIWTVSSAVGSKAWPEWLGGRAHDFRVELVGPPGNKRIKALVHKASGYRRERGPLEAEIARRVAAAHGQPADIRDLVGGPDRPLRLNSDGSNRPPPTRRPLPLASATQRTNRG
jgi:hypothetical protein